LSLPSVGPDGGGVQNHPFRSSANGYCKTFKQARIEGVEEVQHEEGREEREGQWRRRFAPPGSKMEKAVIVMERLMKTKATRKDIIAALVSEANLTKGGAPTYFQLIRTRMQNDES
jgi:hypothetical protein